MFILISMPDGWVVSLDSSPACLNRVHSFLDHHGRKTHPIVPLEGRGLRTGTSPLTGCPRCGVSAAVGEVRAAWVTKGALDARPSWSATWRNVDT